MHLCGPAAAGEIPSSEQEALYGLSGPRESIWPCPLEGYLVIWWALRKLGVEEWIVRLVQGMYANARSRVRVGEGFSKEFEVKVRVHQGSILSPLLFIIVLEALSREFRAGVPWEDLHCICRWSCHHCWLPRGMCQEALDMERSHGEEGIEGKCRKDKGHDLWYRPGPLAEFRRIPMRCLSYRSRQ